MEMETSKDMLMLHFGTNGIQKDELILKVESIFENLKAVLDPIIQPVGETTEDHLKLKSLDGVCGSCWKLFSLPILTSTLEIILNTFITCALPIISFESVDIC